MKEDPLKLKNIIPFTEMLPVSKNKVLELNF
jgi:hypothetical protein